MDTNEKKSVETCILEIIIVASEEYADNNREVEQTTLTYGRNCIDSLAEEA